MTSTNTLVAGDAPDASHSGIVLPNNGSMRDMVMEFHDALSAFIDEKDTLPADVLEFCKDMQQRIVEAQQTVGLSTWVFRYDLPSLIAGMKKLEKQLRKGKLNQLQIVRMQTMYQMSQPFRASSKKDQQAACQQCSTFRQLRLLEDVVGKIPEYLSLDPDFAPEPALLTPDELRILQDPRMSIDERFDVIVNNMSATHDFDKRPSGADIGDIDDPVAKVHATAEAAWYKRYGKQGFQNALLLLAQGR